MAEEKKRPEAALHDSLPVIRNDAVVKQKEGATAPQKGDGYIAPVSYTHLDVYKRQSLYEGCGKDDGSSRKRRIRRGFPLYKKILTTPAGRKINSCPPGFVSLKKVLIRLNGNGEGNSN